MRGQRAGRWDLLVWTTAPASCNRDEGGGVMAGEVKFTPGPWKIAAGDNRYVSLPGIVKPIPCGSQANARLIAASPELYEALEEMLGTFGGADPDDEHGNAVLDRAIAALTKATAAST